MNLVTCLLEKVLTHGDDLTTTDSLVLAALALPGVLYKLNPGLPRTFVARK